MSPSKLLKRKFDEIYPTNTDRNIHSEQSIEGVPVGNQLTAVHPPEEREATKVVAN